MLKIVAVFKNSFGKNHTWSFNDPDPTKSDTEVKSLLERFTRIRLFHKDGTDLFTTVESAKYVETTETIIFDASNPEQQ
ncbi:DUF2922 domain-containing protein [Enterococcus raffinosus]|uniref:DUF2922 domain-containing protein n=1 Tax=Enterococcus raffinosus TaxID=71452 RepID=UPI001C119FB4|nr:DUF2922 domain-containing protein [Enterococcus raffinosus]MBU5359588.1 DUF2922 domain-containing protein [Enterococcus raffinosus]